MQGEPSVRGGVDLAERPPVGAAIQPPMPPTDIRNPDYFHKVVDCQWACPAHTPVPEYIRLIAAGRYTDAYMVNWRIATSSRASSGAPATAPASRPAGAAASRTKPVAICRLKRVAADNKDDVTRLPAARRRRRRTASASRCIGAGPASLTVASDLAPLGYEVVIFDERRRAPAA